jgi:hypothetical protein
MTDEQRGYAQASERRLRERDARAMVALYRVNGGTDEGPTPTLDFYRGACRYFDEHPDNNDDNNNNRKRGQQQCMS